MIPIMKAGSTSSTSVSLVLMLSPPYCALKSCIVFELVSAYGTVGLSLGIPTVSHSTSHNINIMSSIAAQGKLFVIGSLPTTVEGHSLLGHAPRSPSRFTGRDRPSCDASHGVPPEQRKFPGRGRCQSKRAPSEPLFHAFFFE